MTIERIKEALEQAKGGLEWYNKNHPKMKEQIKWQETVIWALEKQVPQKPLAFRADYKCPICDKTFMFGNSIKPNYCKRCGQKLDWSEEK